MIQTANKIAAQVVTVAHSKRNSYRSLWLLIAACVASAIPATGQTKNTGAGSSAVSAASTSVGTDPILKSMQEELDRSKSQLKMDNVQAPYYIEYRLSDVDSYTAESAFGALRADQRAHARSIRVVVRVGDYKQDSYYGPGVGVVDLAPTDNDSIALRRQLWSATDEAYKTASQALAMKKAAMSQYSSGQPFDDFSKATPVQSVEPYAKLDFDPKPWKEATEKSTAIFRTDPKIESLTAYFQARATNQYLVNTEGTATRHGFTIYSLSLTGSTQADDGMRLDRSPYFVGGSIADLPTAEQFQADAVKMVGTLKALREAPMADEDYRGPVLFSPDASTDIVSAMIGSNVLGIRPKPGDSSRTTGDYASNYKGRVLPDFVSVIDDPTMKTFQGKTLIGSYEFDDEGVQAKPVPVIQNGMLINYLLGRMPIRDFPDSNGHGRTAPGQSPSPSLGNLILQSKQTLSPDELKQKLIEICRQEGKPFGYYVETLSGPGYVPRLIYRVYEKDGHEEMVRGAELDELDTRTLRNNLIAVGNDPYVSNRSNTIPTSVVSPSILLDELEVKRNDTKNAKMPEYPAPDLVAAH
jgi:TldD protein